MWIFSLINSAPIDARYCYYWFFKKWRKRIKRQRKIYRGKKKKENGIYNTAECPKEQNEIFTCEISNSPLLLLLLHLHPFSVSPLPSSFILISLYRRTGRKWCCCRAVKEMTSIDLVSHSVRERNKCALLFLTPGPTQVCLSIPYKKNVDWFPPYTLCSSYSSPYLLSFLTVFLHFAKKI